ncbi:ubiquitin-specific protease ubp2, variant 2 [Dionaea muscipula]
MVDEDPVLKERKTCAHVDKGINLDNVSSKLGSSGPFRCQDCREGGVDRRAGKGKGKHGKKKGGGAVDGKKAESKAIWICLECGQFSCGGIGLPTIAQCHAIRHARLTRHPLVIQLDNPHLRWCFPCRTLVRVDKLEENGGLSDIVKLIKQESPKGTSVDIEGVWFGSGSVTSDIQSGSNVTSGVFGRDFHAVRGMVNLGNTCFFNSVMQNLLAIEGLKEYLLNLDGSIGPLTNSLQKLFIETSPEMATGNVISPKALFRCICDKAPQFRGYQQQDSHELLRYLLDGLSTEELSAKRLVESSMENGKSLVLKSTFVDAIFGGQLSSTVCCVECGHSSVVFEPFLDLSLPIPTRKPPQRKSQPLSRNRRAKYPPKRVGKSFDKDSKEQVPLPALDSSYPSESGMASPRLEPSHLPAEENGDSVGCSSSVDPFGHDSVVGPSFPTPHNYDVPTAQYAKADSTDDSTWLDYLEPVPSMHDFDSIGHESIVGSDVPVLRDDNVSTAQNVTQNAVASDDLWFDYIGPTPASDDVYVESNDLNLGVSKDSGTMVVHQENVAGLDTATSNGEVYVHSGYPDYHSWDDEPPLKVLGSEVLLLPYKEESISGDITMKDFDSSSLVVGGGEDLLDFDGFGGLFDEPEVAIGPSIEPSSGAPDFQVGEGFGNSYLVGNTSESDPEEVDDTNSPVSIESCLAHFTKPELLSREHAWHCESCSRESLKRRGKNQLKARSVIQTKAQGYEFSSYAIIDGQPTSMVGCPNSVTADKAGGEEENELPNFADSVMTDASCCLGTSDQAGLNGNAVTSTHFSANHVAEKGSEKALESVEYESGADNEEENNSGNVKVMRDATKTILINKTPSVLTIHLKRFGQDSRGRLTKLNGHIGFKEILNLGPFRDPRSGERGQCIYRLVGVVEHSGTMRGGHYVAYVRGGDRSRGKPMWYYTCDAYVRETSLEDVLRTEAYILFYEKT